jgi:hypothetical protein
MKYTPYQTYCLYLAIKSHFTQKKYDYFKYSGAVRATVESFEKRRDKYHFGRLAKIYDQNEMIDFLVANFIKNKKWIGELLEDDADDNYMSYLKRKQSFSYCFDNEVTKLFNSVSDPRELFICSSNTYPKILTEYLSGTISLETFVVLNQFICFFDRFDETLNKDDVIWSVIRLKATKLTSFLNYDKIKIKETIKRNINI